MSVAGAGAGASALIYDADMNPNDFDEFLEFDDDETLSAAASFPHGLDIDLDLSQDHHPKTFNPQLLQNPQAAPSTLGAIDLGAAESPDSLNDSSFRDSSSDSGSSKRAASASGKPALTNGDIHMMDATTAHDQRKDEWQPSFSQDDADANFLFGNNMASPGLNGRFMADDALFDYSALSNGNSPDAGLGGPMAVSPAMPSFQAAPSARKLPTATTTPNKSKSKAKAQTKKKPASNRNAYPYTQQQSTNGMKMSGSREVSPMSQVMTSHQASPSAVFNNSPSPVNMDFAAHQGPYSNMHMGGPWGNNMPPLDGLPSGFNMASAQDLFRMFLNHQANNARFPPMLGACKLVIHATPPKSRVETQIPIRMTLTGAPPNIKRLHLPTYTVSKPKLLLKEPIEPAPDMLELYIQLVCTSAMQNEENKQRALERARTAPHPRIGSEEELNEDIANLPPQDRPQNGGEVRICSGCITRERKRAGRKKVKRWEEEEVWKKDEFRRVVVFNIGEVREWSSPVADDPTLPKDFNVPPGSLQVDAPMRISCYCRHHQEKLGFQVIFTIKDFQGNMVAQAMSPSIMITDDHKTHPAPPGAAAPHIAPQGSSTHLPQGDADSSMMSIDDNSHNHPAPVSAFRTSQSSLDLQATPRNQPTPNKSQGSVSGPSSSVAMSRPASPSHAMGGPATKKRKASGSRIPRDMTMTRLDTASSPQMQQPPPQAPISAAPSPYAQSPNNFQSPDAMYGQAPSAPNMQQPFMNGNHGMPMTNGREHNVFGNANRSSSFDNVGMALFSAPTSAHPSRAPSPNTLRQGLSLPPSIAQSFGVQQPPQAQHAQLAQTMNQSQQAPVQTPTLPPCIHKIIPGEGPKMGGIEVTILGSNFTQSLVVNFGDVRATTTTFWGDSSLVCLLPPSSVGGVVPVTLKDLRNPNHTPNMPFTPTPNQVFRYLDDEENQLTRMMLGMISQKMTGQLLDVKELAARIMGTADTDWSALVSSGGAGFGGNTYNSGTESQLLKCLELVDLDDSARMPRLDARRSATGQSMLHIGCYLGYHRFVGGLLARGANPDLRDRGGFTPMHMAALRNNETIVRRLMQAGADPTIRSLSGSLPADLATAAPVITHIRRVEHHIRSRSRGSLHSRASSAASLRSFWDPQTALDYGVGSSSSSSSDGEESLEYSSGDFEDEEEAELEDTWLDMRRVRSQPLQPGVDRRGSIPTDGTDLPLEPNSPTAALAAVVRDQVAAQLHQFQQAMQMHFPNFGQMPNLPQMPTLPRMLPNYQNYLEQSHFMDRMSSLMPNMTNSRPGSADDQQPKPEHAKWWDFSSLLNKDTLPPPSYAELYPRGGDAFDEKQASAAQAAAEAMADEKCSRLYDTAQAQVEDVEQVGEASSATDEPRGLTIGRKKDITREQQQDFLRAHAEKFKGMRSDKNLWFIWIPLLTFILAAMLYNRFPQVFAVAYGFIRSVVSGQTPALVPAVMNPLERVIEV
ncbi:ankyrin repeat protein [Plectosphaerella plurivora]|uniref:Ankyrin repeat protein n=1 Tax=Plectosphaerella plurivora TaxID=936078 RepID=A0A9P9ADG9_9PEZI|nr:ankyrin repeat protein [Plectosphaerella plurivora]